MKKKPQVKQNVCCHECKKELEPGSQAVKGLMAIYCSTECLQAAEGKGASAIRFVQIEGESKRKGRGTKGTPLAIEDRLRSFWLAGIDYSEGYNQILIKRDSSGDEYVAFAVRGKEIARRYTETKELFISLGGWNTSVTRSRLKNVIGVPLTGDDAAVITLESGQEYPLKSSSWYAITANAVLQVTKETEAQNNFAQGALSLA